MTTKSSGALIGEERPKQKREKPQQVKPKGKRAAQPPRPKPLKLRKR